MNIEFKCKNCGQPLAIDEEHAGKEAKCPKCKKTLIIPNSETSREIEEKVIPDAEKKIPDEAPLQEGKIQAAAEVIREAEDRLPYNNNTEYEPELSNRLVICPDAALHAIAMRGWGRRGTAEMANLFLVSVLCRIYSEAHSPTKEKALESLVEIFAAPDDNTSGWSDLLETAARELARRKIDAACPKLNALKQRVGGKNLEAISYALKLLGGNQSPASPVPTSPARMRSGRIKRGLSAVEFRSANEETKKQISWDFCGYLEDNFRGSEFGYESFLDLDWDIRVLSEIFAVLKDQAGYIRSTGYMKFRLTGEKREDIFTCLAKTPEGRFQCAEDLSKAIDSVESGERIPHVTLPPASATGTPTKSPEEITNSLGMKLVLIPAGEFMMGNPSSEKDRNSVECPQHRIKITKPFYLGKYEVTQSQYEAVAGKNPSYFKGADNPVEQVSWDDAEEFCRKLSRKEGVTYRLPTEAEWEYACRAVTTTAFHYGDSLSSEQANFKGNYPYGGAKKGPYRAKTMPVGSFRPNAWGLYDMHGNVWEWCGDWCDGGYYNNSPVNDPKGPDSGKYRVLRGGCWISHAVKCRSASRFRYIPSYSDADGGFRCVRSGAL